MVAKSFQNFDFLCDPFYEGEKMYIQVRNPKTGTVRKVRWYPEEPTAEEKLESKRKALGFQKGYVTIFKGSETVNEEWFSRSICRYCVHWGWYVVSTEEVPDDVPAGLTPVRLTWDAAQKLMKG